MRVLGFTGLRVLGFVGLRVLGFKFGIFEIFCRVWRGSVVVDGCLNGVSGTLVFTIYRNLRGLWLAATAFQYG